MENQKVAIMTWYSYQNYGSALQASALYYVIKNSGYKPDFINYEPKGNVLESIKRSFSERLVNKVKAKLTPMYTSAEQSDCFENYLKERVTCTERCNSYPELHDLNKKYDAFVCGSDQIWAPICYDSKYFLDFVEDTKKMVAYAPSIGLLKIENDIIRERMAQDISRFEHLSVRERQGADLIKELTGKDAKVVLDPTLLLNSGEWDSYADIQGAENFPNEHYILCYFLGESRKYMGYVQTLSKKMGIPFYIIPQKVWEKKSGNAVPFEVGPSEFVSLIKNADYVCTDSYHGMAFSINYNIPFSVFKRFSDNDPKNQNSRILGLLKSLQLESRLTDVQAKCAEHTAINCDFSAANRLLKMLRSDSMKYLQDALNEALCEHAVKRSLYKITDRCCGCGACATVCTKKAISIAKDSEGFERCFIDTNKCVGCGQCKTVCPMTDIVAPNVKTAWRMYSVKSRSENVLKKSSSGGVGYELARNLAEQGYAVCGCTYDTETNSAIHVWITPDKKQDISQLQGSKYIQSKSAEAMLHLVEKARRGKVVFFGTPCQTAAADKLLRKKGLRDQAIIVDLICHGVPSAYLWAKYLKDIDEKHHTGAHPIVLFRSKEREWRRLLLLLTGNGHTYKKEEHKDDFYAFFRRGLCYMESCSDCPYRERSAADIRIGDYWGTRFKNDKEGVSMVIANTLQGEAAIADLSQKQICQVETQDLNEYWTVQYPYNPQRPLVRENLIKELKDGQTDLHSLRKKYCTYYDHAEMRGKMVASAKRILKRK